MRGIKTADYQKIYIYIMIFVFIISVVMGAIDNSKYDVIKFGDAHFILPKRIAECVDKNEGEDYVFLQSDKYFILGIGPECDEVDNVILEQFDVSYEKLKGINSIEHEYELTELFRDGSGEVVDSSKTDKPSFDKYFIRYRLKDVEKIILVFKANNKCVIEIIVAPKGDITKKELLKMLGNIRYKYN